MSGAGRIVRVNPVRGIPGGEVAIECADLEASRIRACSAWFDDARGHLVGASTRRVLAIVPDVDGGRDVDVTLECDERRTAPAKFTVASRLAEDLHLVAS